MIGAYIGSFLIGGLVTLSITYFEMNGAPLLSRLAALFPVFTWLSYFFIGKYGSAQQVQSHALFVLLGTLCCWAPYMLAIYFLTPKIGSNAALLVAIILFLLLALAFIHFYQA